MPSQERQKKIEKLKLELEKLGLELDDLIKEGTRIKRKLQEAVDKKKSEQILKSLNN